jgi:predicted Zn-dependent protease
VTSLTGSNSIVNTFTSAGLRHSWPQIKPIGSALARTLRREATVDYWSCSRLQVSQIGALLSGHSRVIGLGDDPEVVYLMDGPAPAEGQTGLVRRQIRLRGP